MNPSHSKPIMIAPSCSICWSSSLAYCSSSSLASRDFHYSKQWELDRYWVLFYVYSSPVGPFLGLYTVYTIKILRTFSQKKKKKTLGAVWYIILNTFFQFLNNIIRIFTFPNGPQYSKENKNLHLSFIYLFIFNNPTYEKRLLLLVW